MKRRVSLAGLHGVRGIVLDLDGTLIRGDRPLAGAVETVAELRRWGVRAVYCTQHTEYADEAIAARLNRLGFYAEPADVISCGTTVAEYLAAHHSCELVRYIGTPLQIEMALQHGVRLAREDEPAPVLLLGLYPGFAASDFETACRLVWGGADFLAVARDRALPTGEGLVPSIGALVRAVEHATRRRARILGKPSVNIAARALRRLKLPAEAVLVVGDSAEVDIRMGKAVGCRTALVLSGSTTLEQAARYSRRARPDMILQDVTALLEGLQTARS